MTVEAAEDEAVTAAFWNSSKHPRGRDGRFISVGDIVSGGGVTGRVTGMNGNKVTVRNPVTGQSSEVKAKDLEHVSAVLPTSLRPSVGPLTPPTVPPSRVPPAQRVTTQVPTSPSLPPRQTGDQLSRGDAFTARTGDGKTLTLTIDGISRRADGGYTVLATDNEGNSRRVVLTGQSTVQPVNRKPVAAAALIKADYYQGTPGAGTKPVKKGKGGGGRKVASKAGEKRYGLPIGTPLGKTNSKKKEDADTQRAYATFEAAQTPADLRKAASWMSNEDLGRAGEALFSFTSANERDEAARMALVREMADRGIDPHQFGYKGGIVQLNPNPKKDPVLKAAEAAQRQVRVAEAKAEREKRAAQVEADKAQRVADAAARDADVAAKKAAQDATDKAEQELLKQAGDALSQGLISERDLKDQFAERRRLATQAKARAAG